MVIVENIIPRNMIINLGCASVDNHIPRDDIFDYHHIREGNIYIVCYRCLYRLGVLELWVLRGLRDILLASFVRPSVRNHITVPIGQVALPLS